MIGSISLFTLYEHPWKEKRTLPDEKMPLSSLEPGRGGVPDLILLRILQQAELLFAQILLGDMLAFLAPLALPQRKG